MVFINHIEILSGVAAIVEIKGALNSETSPDFEDYTNQLMEKNINYILLDAGKLEFVSSDGIGLTLFIQKKLARKNGFFVIYNLPDEIYSLFQILGFDKIFTIADSRIDAMQIMDRQIEMRGSPAEGVPALDAEDVITDDKEPAGEETVKAENAAAISLNEIQENIITDKPDKTVSDVFQPIVVGCVNCSSLIRVKKSGDYICPTCKAEFSVGDDKSVKFQ